MLQLKQEVNKTDKNDARGIANAMRADMYQEVHIKSELSVEMNTLLATRAAHVEQQKQLIATIRGLLKSYAISPDTFNKSNASFVLECHRDDLPKDVYHAFSLSLDALESISKAVREIEKLIKKAMANNEDAALLQTMPGVGPIVAAKFLAILDDPERFKPDVRPISVLSVSDLSEMLFMPPKLMFYDLSEAAWAADRLNR